MVHVKELVQEQKEQIVRIRRELHQIPEPAYTEKKTSTRVADHLKAAGLEVRTGIAKFGVVGLLRSERPGPTLMIRADMDALPVTEQTGLSFSSTHAGAMHACGHDAHMAMVLGAALVLSKMKALKGNISSFSSLLRDPG
jgi:amidohydrolase